MAATGKVIGTVTAVVGEAKATAADGTVRMLQVGDQVHSDESIITSEAGSIHVALEGGKTLDCGGGVDLTLHESILNVAVGPSSDAPAADVDAIQRAIAAGQDPSQIGAATAAGGAPAAGVSDLDGGAHEPVVLEQSNSASVVSSGFATEGETFDFSAPQTQSTQPVVVAAAASVPAESHAESAISSAPAQVTFDNSVSFFVETPAIEQAPAPSIVSTPVETQVVAVVETTPVQEPGPVTVETSVPSPSSDTVVTASDTPASDAPASDTPAPESAPVIIVADAPAEDPVADAPQLPPSSDNAGDTSVVDETPIVVATDTQSDTTNDTVQPPVVTDQTDPTPPVTSNEGSSPEVPTSTENVGALVYSISANTNQDEQLALLTFENDGHTFQSLVFFGQEGQQKPMAAPLDFEVNYAAGSNVSLQYIDSFAGNSDANTGHTATRIAVKDFALGEAGDEILLANQSDGVNIGLGKSIQTEASVQVDGNGNVGEWSFSNGVDQSDRMTYDSQAQQDGGAGGFDILDVQGSLDLTNVDNVSNFEVISLKGAAAQELTLGMDDVLKVSGGDVLHVIGGKEDTLNVAGEGWSVAAGDGNGASYFGWVQVQHMTGSAVDATILVDPDVHVNLLAAAGGA